MADAQTAAICRQWGARVATRNAGDFENLLRYAIARSVQVGVCAVFVRAWHDDARRFYIRYQFEPSPTEPIAPDTVNQRRRGHCESRWGIDEGGVFRW